MSPPTPPGPPPPRRGRAGCGRASPSGLGADRGPRPAGGRLSGGHPGSGGSVLDAGVPVLRVAMLGTDGVQRIGAPVPRLGHSIGVRVGPPLDYTSKADGPRNPKLLREITDDIM